MTWTDLIRTPTLLLALTVAGCAGLQPTPTPAVDANQACLRLFENTDWEIRTVGAADGGAARIAGFPWLRTNRFLSSFREQLDTPSRFESWAAHLADLDREARGFELQNLEASRLQQLQDNWRAVAVQQQLPEPLNGALDHCRTLLNAHLQDDAAARDALRRAAVTPDAYNTWQRALGLYPLTSRIARPRVVKLHERLQQQFDAPVPDTAHLQHYAVPVSDEAQSRPPPEAATVVRQLDRDPLGIPRTDAVSRDLLFEAHAPIWSVDTRSAADRPGALVFDADHRPVVDTDQGVEYRWLSWTRFGEDVLLQLNYQLWFPERPPTSRFDITAGHLAGVIWRATLDSDGQVLAYDSIHPCGCYYAVFPRKGWTAAPMPYHQEPQFAPSPAPVPGQGERLVVLLASGTRYFLDVAISDHSLPIRPLTGLPATDLQSLPQPGGGRRSIYESDGLISASRRPERFLFWPLGIPSAGTMRQPGTQAIAFIGRRHFDDAYLLQDLLIRSTPE